MYRCLIVEDNPVNYMIMHNQVAKLGMFATVCENGKEALDYCTQNPLPQLILLDGYMPVMDGIAFLKALRAMPEGHVPYVLFCSSSVDVINVEEAMQLGADCHFPKPIKPEQFKQVMAALKQRFGPTAAAAM